MIRALKQWWIERKLANAREQLMRYKAEKESIAKTAWKCALYIDKLSDLSGKEAMYEERVETLMRKLGR